MYKIATLNKISPKGLERFSDKYTIIDNPEEAHGILVRSQDMHSMEFSDNLLAIARAGAGVNNIPIDLCSKGNRCFQYTRSKCQCCKGTSTDRNINVSKKCYQCNSMD